MFRQSQNTLVSGGTFVDRRVIYNGQHTHVSKQSAGIDNLMRASSPSAFYNAGNRFDAPKCHPNTRTAILDKIMEWIVGNRILDEFVLWLYGPAGAGKSAIAQTIAERCHAQKLLLATFFFSSTDHNRNQGNTIMATLAYQVALYLPIARELIEQAVDHDPLIFTRSLKDQLVSLIINPILQLSESGALSHSAPRVIIIDGLDECLDPDMQCMILDSISAAMQDLDNHTTLRFLVASRPEAHLYIQFADDKLFPITTRFPLDDKYYPSADITRYLEDSFKKIKASHPLRKFLPDVWPTSRDINTLANKSSGQFIYAATVVHYVSATRNQPVQCLEVVLGLRPPHTNHTPFAQLDALYTKIMSNVEDIPATLRILGFLLFPSVDPTSENLLKIPRLLERFLGLDDGEVQRLLIDLASLISYQDQDTEIRVLHASFGDYLLDETRSKEYFINPLEFNNRLSLMYCEFIQRSHTAHDYSEDDDLTLLHYSYRHLVENCSKVTLSGDVLEELLETPIVPPLFYLGTYQDLQYFLDFFSCLESSTFANVPHIYDHHLKIWDEYLLGEMQNFPSLLYIYVCSVLLHADFTGSIYSTLCCLLPDHWDPEFSHIKWLYTWDRSDNLYGTIERPSPAYRGMLLDFFTDKERSGRYMLSGVAYAAVSALFIEYISINGTTKTRIETRVESKYSDEFDDLDFGSHSPSPPPLDNIDDDHEPIITAALSFLPILLSKSDYSGPLIKLIEKHSFREECRDLPDLEAARNAMSDYKERMRRDQRFQRTRRSRKSHARSL